MNAAVKLIDVRVVPPAQRHPLIFSSFDALATGQALEIVNDHDPMPLKQQFQQTRPGQFDWQYLEAGPLRWHVRVARVADAVPGGLSSGCGGGCSCGG
ncbi:MAG: DUF2249 domain-containing protein [Rubrivivax sp.]|nr:DUF2249 domain-containing protein [Rubrivivax sp.]